jgi:hypothetical protein
VNVTFFNGVHEGDDLLATHLPPEGAVNEAGNFITRKFSFHDKPFRSGYADSNGGTLPDSPDYNRLLFDPNFREAEYGSGSGISSGAETINPAAGKPAAGSRVFLFKGKTGDVCNKPPSASFSETLVLNNTG